MVPGAELPAYDGAAAGRQILCDCEDDLRDWRPGYGLGNDNGDSARPSLETQAPRDVVTSPTTAAAGQPLGNGDGHVGRSNASGAALDDATLQQKTAVKGGPSDGPAGPQSEGVAKQKGVSLGNEVQPLES